MEKIQILQAGHASQPVSGFSQTRQTSREQSAAARYPAESSSCLIAAIIVSQSPIRRILEHGVPPGSEMTS